MIPMAALAVGVVARDAAASTFIAATPPFDQEAPGTGPSLLQFVVFGSLAAIALGLCARQGWYRLRDAPRRPILFEPVVALGLVLAVVMINAIVGPIAAVVLGIKPPAPDAALPLADLARLSLCVYAIQALVVGIYAHRALEARGSSVHPLPSMTAAVIIGVGSILLFWPVVNTVAILGSLLTTALTGVAPDSIAHETLSTMLAERADPWLPVLALLVVFAAPIVEEVMYRGLIQSALIRLGLGRWSAVFATSFIFASMHLGNAAPRAIVALFVLSLAFGWSFEKTGRLTTPIVMHVVFNLGNLVVAFVTIPD